MAVETRLSKLDDREKADKKAADSVTERLTSCEKSIKDVASKSIADVEQKMKNLVKNVEDNSSQVLSIIFLPYSGAKWSKPCEAVNRKSHVDSKV